MNLYTFEIDENVKRDKTVEWDMIVKVDNTTEFVTLLNMWDCWMWYNVKLENNTEFMKLLNKCDCLRRWECKRDKTIDFVALLNMWDCWMKLDCGIK